MPITIFNKTFGMSDVKGLVKSFLPLVCGVPESVLTNISDRYILELYADLGGEFLGFGKGGHEMTIYAYLQDKFTMTAGTQWSGIIQDIPGAEALIKAADSGFQAVGGVSLVSTVSTQRKWTGSDPISINFKLKFEAINDVYKEVLLPCRLLQSLTLPRAGLGNMFFLIPPGPSPYTFWQKDLKDTTERFSSRGENIAINIGGFIGFRSVIVKNVKVTYENRMSAEGPIGAEVELGIETWRMLTREELDKAYTEKPAISGTGSEYKMGTVG
jgi:hypothetical protein